MPNFSLSDEIFERAAQQFPTPFHLYDRIGKTVYTPHKGGDQIGQKYDRCDPRGRKGDC